MGYCVHHDLITYFLLKHREGLTKDEIVEKAIAARWYHDRKDLEDYVAQILLENFSKLIPEKGKYRLALLEEQQPPFTPQQMEEGLPLGPGSVRDAYFIPKNAKPEEVATWKASEGLEDHRVFYFRLGQELEKITGKPLREFFEEENKDT